MNLLSLTADSFDTLLAEHDIILIDFWASWCGPCKSFAKTYEQAATQHPDLCFAKVDIDAEPALAAEFHIRSVPTLVILRQQVMVFCQAGVMPLSALDDLIQQVRDLDMDQVKSQFATAEH